MAVSARGVADKLNLRPGEARPLAVLGGYLLFGTVSTTVLQASKNGLFLSVYPGTLIPHAVIAAALVTAVVAVASAALVSGTARRRLALGLTATLATTLVGARALFAVWPGSAFAIYLWLSTVQVLIVTHGWDYVGDLLTGRQAKRLMPLIGIGASAGAIGGGSAVAPAAILLGTPNLLLVAAALLLASLRLLWLVPEPVRSVVEADTPTRRGALAAAAGAGRGFRTIGGEPLLAVMAGFVLLLSATSTLVELQYKLALQQAFDRDRITAVDGLLTSAVGLGTLGLQIVASRWILPRMGVSFAGRLHAGGLAIAAAGTAVVGGFLARVFLQFLDDTLQNSLQKPVEQISLLPFPGRIKRQAATTLGGVVRPLAAAVAGLLAILLPTGSPLLRVATVATAGTAFWVVRRHGTRYLAALEKALARHSVDFGAAGATPLVVDREALAVLDRGLADAEPTVVIFSLSLLDGIDPEEAVPRAVRVLEHASPEVRAEAARVLGELDVREEARVRQILLARIDVERSPFVLASLLGALAERPDNDRAAAERFLDHPDDGVRRAALVALGRIDPEGTRELLSRWLRSDAPGRRSVAAGAAGRLGVERLADDLADVVADDAARPAALDALARLGGPGVAALAGLLARRDVPLPVRRSVVSALASTPHPDARDALLRLVGDPALGPPALTSLERLRSAGVIQAVDPAPLRPALAEEIGRGFGYGLASRALREDSATDARIAFISAELDGLRVRTLHRACRMLCLAYDPGRIDAALRALLSDDAHSRSNALELLEGMLAREDARHIVPFAELGRDGVDPHVARLFVRAADGVLARPLEHLLDDPDWWVRALALHGLGRHDEISIPGRDPEATPEDDGMIPLIERVMILKGSELFRYFPGSDLAGIASVADVVHLEADDVVFEQGEAGDAFYMVVQGAIRIARGSHELARLGPREGFGEMAILDREVRSATASAAEPTTLLKIDRDSFDRIVEQNPAVARGIYRMLTRRLRNTLAQVAAG